MIQEERERRARLQTEEETRVLDEEARRRTKFRTERERLIQESMALDLKDRDFLNALHIPKYLQEIIDEEGLEGAYVLWRQIDPSNLGINNTGVVDCGVSLVWNIGFTHEMVQRHVFADNGYSPVRSVWESGARNGYGFRSVDVSGSSKTNSICISGKKNEIMPPPDFKELRRPYRYQDERLMPDKIRYPDMRPRLVTSNTETILSGSRLSKPEIRQVLASNYLDTKKCFETISGVAWPFDREVPDQRQLHIQKGVQEVLKYNVIYLPAGEVMFGRILGRSPRDIVLKRNLF